MRHLPAFCLLVLCNSLIATAQVLPTSTGSCGITALGLESCDWMSAVNLRRMDTSKPADVANHDHSGLFVTRYILAPGAPLNPPIEGREVLIVGMNNGELLNEKKSPQSHVNVTNGLVILMPKEEPYLLRSVGKQNIELLLIEVRK